MAASRGGRPKIRGCRLKYKPVINITKRSRAGLFAAALACTLAGGARAAYIGINFQDDWGSDGGAAVTDTAFGIPAANWFNAVRVLNSNGAPFSTNQVVTLPGGGALQLTWQAINTYSLAADIPAMGDDQVIYGYLDDSGAGYAVTIKGFRDFASNYRITGIAASDSASGFADTIVTYQTDTSLLDYPNLQAPSYAGGLWGLSSTSAVISTAAGNNTVQITGAAKSGTLRSTLAALIIDYTPGGNNPPVIETQPKAPTSTIFTAQPFSLSVQASGSQPLLYQWRKDGANILNATNSRYSVASAALSDSGVYDARVSNGAGATNSASVTITISDLRQPAITAAPLPQTVYAGYPVSLTVQAAGGQLGYSWSKDGTPLPGETSATLAFTADAATAGAYSVIVSNSVGTATAMANVTLRTPVANSYEAAVASRQPALYFRMNETGIDLQPKASNSGSLGAAVGGMYIGAVKRPAAGALGADTNTAANYEGGRVTFQYAEAANPNGSFTVEAWAKPNDVAGGSRVIAQSMINGQNPLNADDRSGWAFRQSGSNLQLILGGQVLYNTTITAIGAVAPGVWSHYSFIYDATANTATLLVNGVVVTNVTPELPLEPNTAAPLIIGDRGYGGWGFQGPIDEVAVYAKALTPAQLLAHYLNGSGITVPPVSYKSLVLGDGAVVYARLDEGAFAPNAVNQGTLGSAWNGTFSDAGGLLGAPLIRLGEAGPRPPAFPGFESTNTAMSVTNAFLVAPQVNLGAAVSVAGWLYREAPETGDGDLGWVAWLGDGGFHINPDGELRYHWKGGQWGWSSGLRVPTNVWTFVALVVQNDRATIYMSDGAEVRSAVNSATHAPMATASPVGFAGNQPGRADRHYRGKEDEMAVWNRALNDGEVRYLFGIAAGIPLEIEIVPGGVMRDTKPSGAPLAAFNRGSVWAPSNTDGAMRTRTGVQQFSAATGSQIVVPAVPELNSTSGTITFWMRAPAPIPGPGSEGAILFDRRALGNAGGGDVLLLKDDGSIGVQAETPPGRTSANTFSAGYLPDDIWHHVAYVYDQSLSGSIALYVDGILQAENFNITNWQWAASQPLEIGRSHDGYWKRFEGFMDDFRVYNRKLTSTEISDVFTSDAIVDSAALKARFDFSDTGTGRSLVWPFGTLESSPALGTAADWQPVPGATSPFPFLSNEGNLFFRARL